MVLGKTCFQRAFEFMKKNIIYKEKFHLAIKKNLELSQKQNQENLRSIISFILESYRTVIAEITHKLWNFFKTMASKGAIT